MKRILTLILSLVVLTAETVWSQPIVKNVRTAPNAENTRIVFDISEPVTYEAFILDNPHRLVIDISNAQMATGNSPALWTSTPIKTLRHSARNGGVRIVLDLHQPLRANSFLLPADNEQGHRLVIDLSSNTKAPVVATTTPPPQKTIPTTEAPQVARETKVTPQTVKLPTPLPEKTTQNQTTRKAITTTSKNKPFIVAIDAGHGGEDPGAIGARGTREKHVVMSIARALAAEVNKEPGMKAYLTRDGDYFVPLRSRIDKARANQADIFISIHADAFRHPSARGASVFTLSEHGATSEAARWIAEQENRADLVGGVSLDDKDQMLASILIDLSQTASNQASITLGSAVLNQIDDIAPLHGSKQVQQAGFLVLKSPDIPSILVETEFISNPQAEQKLINKQYQQQVARSIMQGVRQYHRNSSGYHDQLTVTASNQKSEPSYSFSPISTAQASTASTAASTKSLGTQTQQYIVRNGDTLSILAKQFSISIATIKNYNSLKSDRLYVGQTLKIPSK